MKMSTKEVIIHQARTFLDSVEGRYSFDTWCESKDFRPKDRKRIAAAVEVLRLARSNFDKGMFPEVNNKFEGFPGDKQTWDFPTIINGWVHKLSGSEFKILWYIVRHTFGWQKTEDRISYSQFRKGVKKKDGTWLDRGTGLSSRSISNALKKLEAFGFIERVSDPKSGKTSHYKPRFTTSLKSKDPLFKNYTPPSLKIKDTISISTIPNRQIIYDGNHFSVGCDFYEKLKDAYPDIDLLAEFKRMDIWIEANPHKKPKKYVKRFVNNWLSNDIPKTQFKPTIHNAAGQPLGVL